MKEIYNSLKNNLSNIFSILGIILTIYFSVYYIPQYSEELRIKKIENTNNELVNIIQELVYNNHTIDENDLHTIISGKEIKNNIVYPYTINELLIQTQERFLNNKFIPLEQRKKLVEKIDAIRDGLTKSIIEKEEKIKDTRSKIIELLAAIIGIIASILGLISVWTSTKRQKENELEEKIENTQEIFKRQVTDSVLFENEVFDILKELLPNEKIKRTGLDAGVDFNIRYQNDKRIGIEVKYTQGKALSTNIARQLLSFADSGQMPIVLLTNTKLSNQATELINEFNVSHPNSKVDVLVATERGVLKDYLKDYFERSV